MRLAVLGHPIDHSRSPRIHNAALRALDLPGTYIAIDADVARLRQVASQIRLGDMTGANVTMPLKSAAFDLCDEVDTAASRSQAVNTLYTRGGRLVGANTDVPGLVDVGKAVGLAGRPVLVLGTGGAAAAALIAFEGKQLHVSGRSDARAAALCEGLRVSAEIAPWGTGVDGAILVNATPVGMKGEALPGAAVDAAAGVIDMAYGAAPTPLVVAATQRGVAVADGIRVLVSQAAHSFELWTGMPAPRDVMTAAAA